MSRTALCLACLVGCNSSQTITTDGASNPDSDTGHGDTARDGGGPQGSRTIFVIPFENRASSAIYGNTTDAPYINGLLATAAHATMFTDELPSLPSEPHYVWMEAGTNAFSDITFTSDADPSIFNTTASTAHLVTQLAAANVSWMSYQEGITSHTCPITSHGFYAAKHNPFVFFRDVVGNPPTTSAQPCADHHKSYADFARDLNASQLARYVYITPNVCHDMHGGSNCPQGSGASAQIKAGDDWLAAELPPILAYAQAHDAVIFLTWDEGDSSNLIPFLALGPSVKAGAVATVYSHSSLLKSTEELLDVPVLAKVTNAHDFADMFQAGVFD